MEELLDDFQRMFDPDFPVGRHTLGQLVRRVIADLPELDPDWGTEGDREELISTGNRFAGFQYRPHLFPGMEPKLRLAHALQFGMLPHALPAESPFSIAAVLESYCHLSGDLFGWRVLQDGRFLIWILDMSGHGVHAGLGSTVLRVLLDAMSERRDVERVVAVLSRSLFACRRTDFDNLFATGFFMAVGPSGEAVYASAGHPPMIVRRVDGSLEHLKALDIPIGLFPETDFARQAVRFSPGDSFLLFTDGVIEATGQDGEPFGLRRLREEFAPAERSPTQVTRAIFDRLNKRQDMAKLDDDVTIVAARFDR